MDLQPDNVVEPALEAGLPGRCHTHVLEPWGKNALFLLNFSYVCPEPVLAKRSSWVCSGLEKASFSQLCLCLSRACLGKKIVFIYKRHFVRTVPREQRLDWVASTPRRKHVIFELLLPTCRKERSSFSTTFPMFVPSLSWQNDGLSVKWHRKKTLCAPEIVGNVSSLGVGGGAGAGGGGGGGGGGAGGSPAQ
jgi:uncharacterized membrane protein YgcG